MHKRKMGVIILSCDITASVLTNNHAHMIVDSEYAQYILSLHKAGLC